MFDDPHAYLILETTQDDGSTLAGELLCFGDSS